MFLSFKILVLTRLTIFECSILVAIVKKILRSSGKIDSFLSWNNSLIIMYHVLWKGKYTYNDYKNLYTDKMCLVYQIWKTDS